MRAERVGAGNGRVSTIATFTATDSFRGTCTGTVSVDVLVSCRGDAVDDRPAFDVTAVP